MYHLLLPVIMLDVYKRQVEVTLKNAVIIDESNISNEHVHLTSVVIACAELGKIGEVNESVNSETLSSTAPFVINGYTYKSFGSNAKYDYAVFVRGTDCLLYTSRCV